MSLDDGVFILTVKVVDSPSLSSVCSITTESIVASSSLNNDMYTSDGSPPAAFIFVLELLEEGVLLDIVNRDARVNSLIIGTSCEYFVSKCDFNCELDIPLPLYCGLDSSWMNSSYNGLLLDDDVVVLIDDVDADFFDATLFVFDAATLIGTAVVRLRLTLAEAATAAMGRFFGGIIDEDNNVINY